MRTSARSLANHTVRGPFCALATSTSARSRSGPDIRRRKRARASAAAGNLEEGLGAGLPMAAARVLNRVVEPEEMPKAIDEQLKINEAPRRVP